VSLAGWSALRQPPAVLLGDAMFLCASALGALYVLQMRSWGVGCVQAAAIVSVYSALVVVPWHLCCADQSLLRIAPVELLWQALWQGVLIGCISLIALNRAIDRLGAERSSALVALVPALSALLALFFLREVPSLAETAGILAISAGVTVAVSSAPSQPVMGEVPLRAARR